MAAPRISYTILTSPVSTLTIDPGVPSIFSMKPRPPVTVNVSMTGLREFIITPRVDISVHMEFPVTPLDTISQLVKLINWYQHACRGGAWSFAMDSAKVVDTTVSGASLGATSIVVASATGINSGQIYKLIDGGYYQEILVSGTSGTTISFATTPLITDITSGAIFRDQLYFPAQFAQTPDSPIVLADAGIATWPLTRPFRLVIDFMEKVA
jgi:hypothetical protein